MELKLSHRQQGPRLRGEKLEARVKQVIRDCADEAVKNGRRYVYNASRVARLVPTTRRSLGRHECFIEGVLKDLRAPRRSVSGAAMIAEMRAKIERLETLLADRELELRALSEQYIEFFVRFYGKSLDGDLLVAPLPSAHDAAGNCLLCRRPARRLRKRRH